MGQDSGPLPESGGATLPWRYMWIALAISIAGTAVLGGVLILIMDDVWWVAIGGAASLIGGGVHLGRVAHEPEPLYGTLLAALYYLLVVVILFGGTLIEKLPDPLPGLERGDSTFFFVFPLLMLAAGVAGSVLGGRGRDARA